MHILIVDDELLARSRLRTLLGDCDARHQVSEAAHAADALAQLNISGGRAVDLVLLDIHMPGQDGLALAQQIRRLPHPPTIVFVTAHADHALSRLRARRRGLPDQARAPAAPAAGPGQGTARQRSDRHCASDVAPDEGEVLLIQERGRTERVPLAEVLFLRAEQKYVTVRTATRSFIVDDALSELEARHAAHFLRVHRSTLVARRAMRALERHYDAAEGEGWAVRLQGLTELLPVSRRQVAAVREALAG